MRRHIHLIVAIIGGLVTLVGVISSIVVPYSVGTAVIMSGLGVCVATCVLDTKSNPNEPDPDHRACLVNTAVLEMENYGKVVSDSVLDELRKNYSSIHFGNQTFYPPPPNPGRRTFHSTMLPPGPPPAPPTRPSPLRGELR